MKKIPSLSPINYRVSPVTPPRCVPFAYKADSTVNYSHCKGNNPQQKYPQELIHHASNISPGND